MAGVLIVGAGPGIATSIARRFGAAGLPVALVARSQATIDAAADALRADGIAPAGALADASDEDQLRAALDALVAQQGVPEALVYNAGLIRFDGPGELSHAEHQAAYATNVLGALTAASHLAPAMAQAGGGTILITGGMPQPAAALVSLSLGKAGVRALTELLAEAYGPSGVHVATVAVAGAVAPGTPFDPDLIAAHYWRLHGQPADAWERDVLFAGEPG